MSPQRMYSFYKRKIYEIYVISIDHRNKITVKFLYSYLINCILDLKLLLEYNCFRKTYSLLTQNLA